MTKIETTRRVYYRGGFSIPKGLCFEAKKDTDGNYHIAHPRFTDDKIRLHIPATHAKEIA